MSCCCDTNTPAVYVLTMKVFGQPGDYSGHRSCCRRCTLAALLRGEHWRNGRATAIAIRPEKIRRFN